MSRPDPSIIQFDDPASVQPWTTALPYANLNLADDEAGERARREKGDDPRDTPPPSIYGEEIAGDCNPVYVDGIPAARDCTPRRLAAASTCKGSITGFIFPGSRWDNPAGVRAAIAEINRAFEFFAGYCIGLRLNQLNLTPRDLRRLRAWYAQWFARLVTAVGGADHLGTTTIPTGLINDYRGTMANLQALAAGQQVKLLVIFCDEYLNDYRPSLGSSNRRDSQQIGIAWIDSRSPYILAHELVHALGKSAPGTPGAVTWDHKSACPLALTTIARTAGSRQPIDLSGRYLDIAEDREIRANLGGDVLTCSAI